MLLINEPLSNLLLEVMTWNALLARQTPARADRAQRMYLLIRHIWLVCTSLSSFLPQGPGSLPTGFFNLHLRPTICPWTYSISDKTVSQPQYLFATVKDVSTSEPNVNNSWITYDICLASNVSVRYPGNKNSYKFSESSRGVIYAGHRFR
jgi:hypothetical protein